MKEIEWDRKWGEEIRVGIKQNKWREWERGRWNVRENVGMK